MQQISKAARPTFSTITSVINYSFSLQNYKFVKYCCESGVKICCYVGNLVSTFRK